MLLTEDHHAIQDAVRAYVQDRIAPFAAQWDKTCHFPKDELRGLAELGCYGIAVPSEWDGAGLDYLSLGDHHRGDRRGRRRDFDGRERQQLPGLLHLMAWASDAQKDAWLKPLARGKSARRVLPDRAACRFAGRWPDDDGATRG